MAYAPPTGVPPPPTSFAMTKMGGSCAEETGIRLAARIRFYRDPWGREGVENILNRPSFGRFDPRLMAVGADFYGAMEPA